MTFYLPNNDVRPTGWEALEFIDAPTYVEPRVVQATDAPSGSGLDDAAVAPTGDETSAATGERAREFDRGEQRRGRQTLGRSETTPTEVKP